MHVKRPLIVFVIVTALLLVPLPLGALARSYTKFAITLENTAHPLVFWWLTAHLLSVVRGSVRSLPMAYVISLGLAVLFGLGTEYLQSMVGRDASWEDARNDAIGALFALATQGRRDLASARRREWIPFASILALSAAGASLFPLAWTGTAYVLRWNSLPLIWSPDALFTRRFSYWKQDAFPGLVIDEPARDWRGYSALQVKVRSLVPTGTEIRIRVHDQRHNQEFLDRYDRAFELPDQRERTLTIPLRDIARGPAARELDLSAVKGIIIFQEAAREPPRFAVKEIRLVR